MNFLRHCFNAQRLERKQPLAALAAKDRMHHWAHRRPGYPLSGCGPVKSDSVSPGDSKIPMRTGMFQLPLDNGVNAFKIQ